MPGSRRGIGVEVDADAGARPIGRLGRRAGDAGGAEVLQPLDEPALDELERRLDQQLLGERVADLDRGPLRGVVVGERRGGEDRRSPDAVAAGRAPEQDGEVARARAPPRGSGGAPRAAPIAITLTSGLSAYDGSKTSSPPTVGTPTQLP